MFNNEQIVSPDYQMTCFGDTYSLYIPEVFDEDAGRFAVIAENESGKATCSALLEVRQTGHKINQKSNFSHKKDVSLKFLYQNEAM